MKGPVLILLWFMVTAMVANAQQNPYEPLAGYDLGKGTYSLLFLPLGNDSAYYLYEIKSLLNLQKSWRFQEEAVVYPFACNDGYEVSLLESGQVVDQYSIRLRCQAFYADHEAWHLSGFTPVLMPGVQRLSIRDTLFDDLQQARIALNELRSDQGVTWVEPPSWEHFEGFFHFNVPNPNHTGKSPFTPWERVEEQIVQEVTAAFPGTRFQLILHRYGYGKHYPTLGFKLMGRKELFKAFDLYPKSTWGWQPLKLKLTFYKH